MNTIELFKDYLLNNSSASKITVKNYISDVNKFIRWFDQKYQTPFSPFSLTGEVVKEFIKDRGQMITGPDSGNGLINGAIPSSRSFERYLSSLRRFAAFLYEANFLSENPFSQISKSVEITSNQDPWSLKSFKDFLYVEGASKITSKNYMVDLNAFTSWLDYKGLTAGSSNFMEAINPEIIDEYTGMLSSELDLSPSTIARKTSSIRKFLSFAKKRGLINPDIDIKPQAIKEVETVSIEAEQEIADAELPWVDNEIFQADLSLGDLEPEIETPFKYSSFAPFRLVQRLSQPYFLFEEAAASKIAGMITTKVRFSGINIRKPEWYKKYHNIAFTHYLHLAILVIYASIVGIILYNGFVSDAQKNKTLAASPPKVLSFQGRLTDENNNPITNTSNVRFQIYSDDEATGSAYLLWQELNQVEPDENGVFSILLGNTTTVCSSPTSVATGACSIPVGLFSNNTNLYLGITIENTPELTPRQQLANVPYASNAQTLEGMLPITDSNATQANVVLALDSSGRLSIGGSATPIFQATGGVFTLTGQGLYLKTNEGSNYDIKLEPDGAGKIDLRSPLVNNGEKGLIAPGGVEINDKAAILATESAVAAFVVNNDGTSDIFAASASGTTQFKISSSGDISIAADGSIDTIGSGEISIGNLNTTTINIGRIGEEITLPGYTSRNGVLYGGFGTGILTQATTSVAGLCLVSGASNPTWDSCSSSFNSPFQQSGGTIFANNSTLDFLVGGQATSSADFSITGVNGSGPVTASLSGSLIVMPVNGAGGRSGFGTNSPSTAVHMASGADENILTISDTDGSCTVNPESGATDFVCSSDERLKTNIVDAGDVLEDLSKIRIRDYTVKASGNKMTGVIAQELSQNFPNMVTEGKDGLLMVGQVSSWTLVKAIQELNTNISQLSQNISSEAISAGSVAAESITIAGISLQDYVRQVIEESEADYRAITGELVSPLASIDQIHTGVISPLPDSNEVVVKANLAVEGNATVSGVFTASSASISGELTATSASISGTLYAQNIQADSIDGLDRRIMSAYREQLASLASSGSGIMTSTLNTDEPINISSIESDFATFKEGLVALGPSSFTQASVADTLSIGNNMQIGSNSINTLGSDLALQPLRQGAIDFMAGAVRIDTDGTLKVTGNATFAKDVEIKGTLRTDNIEPTAAGLTVSGTATVSGGLTTSKLNLFKAQPAYALSDTEVVATGSAGTATISPNRAELTVYNPNVTADSLIYITPVGSSTNITPSLLRQTPDISFTVGIPQLTNIEVKFNWIIVN